MSLPYADTYAARGDVVGCAGSPARAAVAVAYARLAERGEWALNDKGMGRRAGLSDSGGMMAAVGHGPDEFGDTVTAVRRLLARIIHRRPFVVTASAVLAPE